MSEPPDQRIPTADGWPPATRETPGTAPSSHEVRPEQESTRATPAVPVTGQGETATPDGSGGPRSSGESTGGLARSALIMTIGTGLSRITGLLRVVALTVTLGITESKVADTYNLANTTPNIIYELILGGILSAIFVPVFVQARKQQGQEGAWQLARLVLTLTVVALGTLAVVGMLGAEWIMWVYTLGVDDPEVRAAQIRVGSVLLVMFLPQIVFYGLGTVMTGMLNANRRFGVPMFAPILNNLVVIGVGVAYYVLAAGQVKQLEELTRGDLLLLGLGTTAGVVVMAMVQWPFLRRLGFRYRPAWNPRHPELRKMAGLSAFTIGFVVVNQLAYMVIPILAAQVQGGYTAYQNALMFFQLPHGLFAVSIITALLPTMSEQALTKDWDRFRASLAQGVRLTGFVLFPATVGYLILAEPLTSLLLQHGVVQPESIALLSRVLVVLTLGLVPFSLFQLTLRAFYALQDTRVPFQVNLVAAGVRVVLDVVLFMLLPTEWKIAGIAAGHAVSYTVGLALLLRRLRPRIGGRLGGLKITEALTRMLLASLLMGVVVALVAAGSQTLTTRLLGSDTGLLLDLVAVVTGLLSGLTAYLVAARVLRIEELRQLGGLVGRRLGGRRAA